MDKQLSLSEDNYNSPITIRKSSFSTNNKFDFKRKPNMKKSNWKFSNSVTDLHSQGKVGLGSRIQTSLVNKFNILQPRIKHKPAKGSLSKMTSELNKVTDSAEECSTSSAKDKRDSKILLKSKTTRYDQSKIVYHYAYKHDLKEKKHDHNIQVNSRKMDQSNGGINLELFSKMTSDKSKYKHFIRNKFINFIPSPLSVETNIDESEMDNTKRMLRFPTVNSDIIDSSSGSEETSHSNKSNVSKEGSRSADNSTVFMTPEYSNSHDELHGTTKNITLVPQSDLFIDHLESSENSAIDNEYNPTEDHDKIVEDHFSDLTRIKFTNNDKMKNLSKTFFEMFNGRKTNFQNNDLTSAASLDSESKSKEFEEVQDENNFVDVKIKWVIYNGQSSQDSSWNQRRMHLGNEELILAEETSVTTANDELSENRTNRTMPLINSTVKEDSVKKGYILKIKNLGNQSECKIEFENKIVADEWLSILSAKIKSLEGRKVVKDSSFKRAFSNEEFQSNQDQFIKPVSKTKELTKTVSTHSFQHPQPNKTILQQTMRRIMKLKHKSASNSHIGDINKEQKITGLLSVSDDAQCTMASSFNPPDSDLKQNDFNQTGPGSILLSHSQRSVSSSFIPLTVELCISIIENFGMNLVGLYRVPGNKLTIDYISAQLQKPILEIDVISEKWNDIHAISSVLKSFFRNMSDGLFPKDLYYHLIGSCKHYEYDRQIQLMSIRQFLTIMNQANDRPELRYHHETLRYLMEHLSRVASNETTNRMNAQNLAVIFSPTIFKCQQETNDILINDYKYKIQLIELMIKHHKWLFSKSFERPCSNVSSDCGDDSIIHKAHVSDDLLFAPDHRKTADSEINRIDVRPLVKEILEQVITVSEIHDESPQDSQQLPSVERTFSSLSRQAYNAITMAIGYKEVDIDEECDKRTRSSDIHHPLMKLKLTTEHIFRRCTRHISKLKYIEKHCRDNLFQLQDKIRKVDDEISKTERFIVNTNSVNILSSKPLLSLSGSSSFSVKSNIMSGFNEISVEELSDLSAVFVPPKLNFTQSQSVDNGSLTNIQCTDL